MDFSKGGPTRLHGYFQLVRYYEYLINKQVQIVHNSTLKDFIIYSWFVYMSYISEHSKQIGVCKYITSVAKYANIFWSSLPFALHSVSQGNIIQCD